MNKSQRLRRDLVRKFEREGIIKTERVRDAFLSVPRELFVPEYEAKNTLDAVYKNEPIATFFDANGLSVSSSSAPSIMAIMLEDLELQPGHRVLEIGAGTGYNAALMKHIVGPRGRVTSIEIDPVIVRGAKANLRFAGYAARVRPGDGELGFWRTHPTTASSRRERGRCTARAVPAAAVRRSSPAPPSTQPGRLASPGCRDVQEGLRRADVRIDRARGVHGIAR